MFNIEKLVTPKFYSNLTQSQFNLLVKDNDAELDAEIY